MGEVVVAASILTGASLIILIATLLIPLAFISPFMGGK